MILLSADGPVFVLKVPDVVADSLQEYVNWYYDHWYYKHKIGEPFDPILEFAEFITRKCPEHPVEIVEKIAFAEDIPEKYEKCPWWNF